MDSDSNKSISGSVKAVFFIVGLMFLWQVREILLLLFGRVLLGVALKRVKHRIQDATDWPHALCLLIVLLSLALAVASLGFLMAPPLITQTKALAKASPDIWQKIQDQAESLTWLTSWWEQNREDLAGSITQHSPKSFSWIFKALGGMVSTSVSLTTGMVVVFGIGFYLAVEPRLYVSGIVSIVPKRWHSRVRDALTRSGSAISGWMVGQLASMTIVAIGITIGLWLLGVPHSLALGALAGLLAFAPNLGPIIAFIPAVLVAFAHQPMLAVWTATLYIGVQLIESVLITPLLQKKIISMPPALLLGFQVISGTLAGLAGLLVAAPLLATIMTLIQCLYVEGTLGKEET